MCNYHESNAGSSSDRYTIERELGSGGMATVYLATQESLGRSVVLKILDKVR